MTCDHGFRKWQNIHSIVGVVFDPVHDVAFAPNLGRCAVAGVFEFTVIVCTVDHTICWLWLQKMWISSTSLLQGMVYFIQTIHCILNDRMSSAKISQQNK